MASLNDFAAKGKVLSVDGTKIVFAPSGTNYQLTLDSPGHKYTGPMNQVVFALIHVNARKVYTVPTGGNFVSPIFGPPKILQGRVRFVTDKEIVIHAGVNIVVSLPASDDAMDLNNGEITEGLAVNVVAMPGATYEIRELVFQ